MFRKLSIVFVIAPIAFTAGRQRAGARPGQGDGGRRLRDHTAEGGRDGRAGQLDALQAPSAPAQKFQAAVAGLDGKAKSGGIDPSDVDGASSALAGLHSAATKGKVGFTDNTSVSVG